MMPSFIRAFGLRASAGRQVAELMKKNHPEEPHWYLAAIGSDPTVRGAGFGQALITIPGTNDALLPAAQTDTIYSLIVNEIGLFGACGLILVYLLITARGFRVALLADDGFSKLLAAGLTFGFALQTFIIVGGVLRVIPLTGITLPFVSYGGSSVVANFILLALLLLVSNRANMQVARGRT